MELVFPTEQRADLFTVQYNQDNGSLQNKVQADSLSVHYKRFEFPKSGFLSYDTNPLCKQHPPGPLHVLPKALERIMEFMLCC